MVRKPRARRTRSARNSDNPAQSAAGFAALLDSAVTEPGIVSAAYRQFHGYSIGNQLLAWTQCLARRLSPGRWPPIRVGRSSDARCGRANARSVCACR